MKKEKDLCIKILRFIEENQTLYRERYTSDDIKIEGYTDDQIIYHLDLLEDDNFIKFENTNAISNSWRNIKLITNTGYDVLDSIKG